MKRKGKWSYWGSSCKGKEEVLIIIIIRIRIKIRIRVSWVKSKNR